MNTIKEGDQVKRRRHRRDLTFKVEKIHHGFAFIRNDTLPITTVEPLRDLVLVKRETRKKISSDEKEESSRS